MLEIWVAIIYIVFKLLPYAALLLFVIRLINFIVCEDAFESDDLKKKTIHSAFFVGGAVIVRGYCLRTIAALDLINNPDARRRT